MDTDPAAENEEETPCAPQRKVVKKMASLLVKPKVQFVSLVGHAANGLAFSMVKDEDGTSTPIQPPDDHPMPKAVIPAFGSAGASLNRLEFDKTLFKSEADVEAYLQKSNIAASRITSTDTHYIVPGVHEDSLEQIEAVKGDMDGVTYFIGKLKAPIQSRITPPTIQTGTKTVAVSKGEGNTPARLRGDEEENEFERVFKSEMAPELETVVQKMDSYIARQVGTTTVDETLATGTPEIPGLWEIMSAVRITVENIVAKADPSDYTTKIQAAFARGGQIASGLAGIFVSVQKSDNGETAVVDREAIAKHFSSPTPEAAPKAGEGEGVVKKSETDPTPTMDPATAPDIAAIVAKSISEALAPIVAKVDSLTGTVENVQKSVTESVQNIETRVVGLEEVRQVRKSLPDDGTPAPVEKSEQEKQEEVKKAERLRKEQDEAAKDAAFAARQARSRFGIV